MKNIILATTSPYRIETFKSLGLPVLSEPSNVNEDFSGRPDNVPELVQHLARLKAEAVASKHLNEDKI